VSTSADSPGAAGAPASIPAPWVELVDDAAIFPPGEAPLTDAVAAYRERRDEPWAALVGPLVVSDGALTELAGLTEPDADVAALPVSVVCSGGAGSLGPAAHWAGQTRGVELQALELALRDLDDLAGSARRVVRAAEAVAISGVEAPVYVEVPSLPPDGQPGPGWLDALDEIAAADLRLKFRTGGLEEHLFPSPAALAGAIEAALDRELPFKCTAGLHHAVRHRDVATGIEHHGFLNVLLATRASLDGGDAAEVLAQTDPAALVSQVEERGTDVLARARRWFASFGCCGVDDPYHDLLDLGLL
jgi:hypothetical protein